MVELNHTIVAARDQDATARFFTEVLGLAEPQRFGPFLMVQPENSVTLDVAAADGAITSQHYAFLVRDDEFDEIFGRVTERGLKYWADPHHTEPDTINTRDGGRGFYFDDPNGHILEVLTREYGSGAEQRG
ncbi:MAG: VOC family protein [Saccharopolyspora sp.]|uniref:VOC family protein n=1 Tax=Saccharopolyspora TaxID=1835 RepID=UPI00190B87C4|nr:MULTISPECIES: VOC family protein [unclassified Saccharopolyspora]MBK0866998.1 VOC family protein [Saccharopolyspora sp. HNM0986]MBQ6643230.1 VOC family protein [Saccharopolyspora sp.]